MTDSILVVGGGVAGLSAALECAAGGARVTVVERGPILGGRLAAPMTAENSIGDRAEGDKLPLLAAIEGSDKIEVLTNATLEQVEGGPGNFDVSIRECARFVTDACTRCKLCHTACPVVKANEYDAGLTFRKAIYTPMAETMPAAYVIDIESCLNTPPNYLPCNRCVEVCDDDAIHFDQALETIQDRHVGAVILAPGFRLEDNDAYAELGYGTHPDIVTSAELQRLMETPGPTGGYATRPSNEEYPESVLLVIDNLSRFALYIVASQTRQLLEQDVGTVAILILAQPGSGAEALKAQEFASTSGVSLYWGTVFSADATDDLKLEVSFEDLSSHRFVKQVYELVVLCTDVQPAVGIADLARVTDIEVSDAGYLRAEQSNGVSIATSRPGVFLAGCASGPKNIKESIAEASAAAKAALGQLDPRLLDASAAAEARPATGKDDKPVPSDDLQHQIEGLLYALLDRSGA